MARLNGNESTEHPEDLVQSFAASQNFPKERAGVLALAQALKRASEDFKITMTEIVRECCDTSPWCPTPRDIRVTAMAMRDDRRNKAQGSQKAEWERVYGPPDTDWPAELMGVMLDSKHGDVVQAAHIRAIRDTLYYTEGDGTKQGDREFWDGDHSNYGARRYNQEHYPELVAAVRKAGGWQTERELQMDWIDLPAEVVSAALAKDRAGNRSPNEKARRR